MLIRALRGEQTRAAFAARLGITEQTVYRWELSPTAKEARRPRGEVRARLLALLAGPSRTDEDALVPPAPPALPSRDLRDDTGAILASLLRALSGELRRSHHELLTAATRADTSRDGRALAQAGLAILEGLFHCDGQRALASIGGFLATIDTYADAVRPWLHASAALTFAQADARLLDVGRVQAHGGAIRLDAHPEAWLVAWLAGLSVAFATSDFDLVRQVLARLGPDAPSGMPPLLDLHIDESRALAALVNGQHAVAAGRFRAVAGTAHALGHAAVEARALACLAMRQLDDLAAPEQVLAGARASRQIANDARLGYGIHTFLALRAEGEALLRLGLVDELPTLLEAIAHAHDEAGFEATPAGQLVARVAMLQGRHADLFAQAERLESCDVPSLASLARGQAAFMRGLGHLARATDRAAGVRAWERAERLVEGWPFLWRETLLHGTTMRIVAGDHEDAAHSLRRLARALDASPSPWLGAHLRRAEGTLRAATGDWATARELLAAAAATFDLAEDRVDAALVRVVSATFAQHYDEPSAEHHRRVAEETATALGVAIPAGLRVGIEALAERAHPPPTELGSSDLLPKLVVAVRRLTVRGTTASLLQRELLLVVRDLFPGHAVRLDEIDSHGHAILVDGPTALNDAFSEELGDGSGRRLRLSVAGLASAGERAALRVLADAAGLSLEVTTLRAAGSLGGEASRADSDDEIPGFIGISPAIRRLRTEIARLGSSRATVIITGESGSGKELVARAIHDLSTRRGRSYVPFNCATVPRDLFEGQLFGFKRGSFTGASADHPGVLRSADGGTLFLDEVGELPLDVQPKLLRFLENGEVFPLGAKHAVRVDVRIVAATHRDLGALVRTGQFREDLYYRLQVVPLRVPPLRERPEDIAPLARHFLRSLAPEGRVPVLSPDALGVLVRHRFPGNVRELRNVIERALAFAPPPEILHAEHLRLLPGPAGLYQGRLLVRFAPRHDAIDLADLRKQERPDHDDHERAEPAHDGRRARANQRCDRARLELP